MSLLLCLETATQACSVAVFQENRLLAAADVFTEKSHSSRLTTLLEQTTQHAGFALADLTAVAVGRGPGSYTGLRIGVSTAKGLCMALGVPLVSVPTLLGMAARVQGFFSEETLLCPMLEARRMEVYTALYEARSLREVAPVSAMVLDETSFRETLESRRVVFFGEGAGKFQPLAGLHPNAVFLQDFMYPSATGIGPIAVRKVADGLFEDLAAFEPFYLKEFAGTLPKAKLQQG